MNSSDHLGNVRVVLGDKKTKTGNNPFVPEVVSYSGYFPFGMQMQEETWQSPLYRYGYNGKEKDGELHGEGNSYDYGARMYDPRAGRWMGTDPLAAKYPSISSYVYVGNNPLNYIDPTGESGEAIIDHDNKSIAVNSHIVFYGDQASEENCFKVTQKINEAMNGGVNNVSINGAEYAVRFSVTFEIVDSRAKAVSMQAENIASTCDNYVCLTQDIGVNTNPKTGISKSGVSWMRGNVGEWQMTDILSSNGQLNYVVAHEFKHGLGYYSHNALNGESPMDIGVGGESFRNNAYREVLFAAPNALSLRQLFSNASYNNMFGRTMDVVPFKSSGIQIYRMGETGLTPPYKGQISD